MPVRDRRPTRVVIGVVGVRKVCAMGRYIIQVREEMAVNDFDRPWRWRVWDSKLETIAAMSQPVTYRSQDLAVAQARKAVSTLEAKSGPPGDSWVTVE